MYLYYRKGFTKDDLRISITKKINYHMIRPLNATYISSIHFSCIKHVYNLQFKTSELNTSFSFTTTIL